MSEAERPRRDHTVADVAKEAGVSKAQAARALGEYGAVSDAVRSRVLKAAERLSYRPNQLARSMNTGRSQSVGVVVGDIQNPYFSLATRGISDAVEEHGFNLILVNTSERLQAERWAVDMLMDKRVDGLIVAPASAQEHAHLSSVLSGGRPLVLLDRTVPGLPVDVARTNMRPAALEAANLLLDLGHRRIGYISTAGNDDPDHATKPLSSSVAERVEALAEAFERRGLVWDRSLLRAGLRGEVAIGEAVVSLLGDRDPVTALIASDSLIGQVVIGALQAQGRRVPEEVSMMMYDDQPWASLVTPPITVVAQPVYDIGYAAGARLAALIQGAAELPALQPFEARLITRQSLGRVASDVGSAR